MNRLRLAYEITLPSHLYPHLRRLFAVGRFHANQLVEQFWSREWIERLGSSGNVWKPIDEASERPPHIPSRVWRNICAEVGSVLKASFERMVLTERLLNRPELIEAPVWKAAKILKAKKLFVENIQRQLRNYRKNHGKLPEGFFELGVPEYNSSEFTTEADDSVCKGQFKKLSVDVGAYRYTLHIKLPVNWKRWGWFRIEQSLPERVVELLRQSAVLKAPAMVRRKRKCGREYYALKLVLEAEASKTSDTGKVLALDLSPSVNRLGVVVVYDGNGKSKPIYLSAQKLVKKALRIQKEIDRLEHKIDEAHRRKDFGRLRHLFAEQERRRNKLKAVRKQVLETFVDELVLLARLNSCSLIAVENLSGIKVPEWRNKVLRYLFSGWFHGRVVERLRHKAARYGIKVIWVSPKNTSRFCHVCGSKLAGRGFYLKCKVCDRVWDRDYNAAVNIARKAFDRQVSRGQPEELDSEGVRQREPSRLTPRLGTEVKANLKHTILFAWLCVVKCSAFAHLVSKRKLWLGKR